MQLAACSLAVIQAVVYQRVICCMLLWPSCCVYTLFVPGFQTQLQ